MTGSRQLEELFERAGDRLVQQRIYDSNVQRTELEQRRVGCGAGFARTFQGLSTAPGIPGQFPSGVGTGSHCITRVGRLRSG